MNGRSVPRIDYLHMRGTPSEGAFAAINNTMKGNVAVSKYDMKV